MLPVVEIDPSNASVRTRNSPVLLTLFALGLGYLWGVAAATFLQPAYVCCRSPSGLRGAGAADVS